MTSMAILKCGKNDGIAAYNSRKTVLKKMTAKIE
jgi:hypothetical protein